MTGGQLPQRSSSCRLNFIASSAYGFHVGSSGLIIAFVVAVWAAYFVPLVLRRYDEAGKNSTLDLEGPLRRVISPRRHTVREDQPVSAHTSPSPVSSPTEAP